MGKDTIPFISEVPIIEIRKDTVVDRARSGDKTTERAMPVETFRKYIERGQRALREHAAGDQSIIMDS